MRRAWPGPRRPRRIREVPRGGSPSGPSPAPVGDPDAWYVLRMLRALYLATASLLVVHELDSTFWREWELFGIPGGEAGFVLAHLPLVALVVWGYGRLVAGGRAGLWTSVALAAGGIAAPILHGVFLAAGRPEFRTATSLAVICCVGLASVALLALTLRTLRRAPAGLSAGPTPTTPPA